MVHQVDFSQGIEGHYVRPCMAIEPSIFVEVDLGKWLASLFP
jgi:hypothetical protein